jgi:transglutaminase-like putative cysteine protease
MRGLRDRISLQLATTASDRNAATGAVETVPSRIWFGTGHEVRAIAVRTETNQIPRPAFRAFHTMSDVSSHRSISKRYFWKLFLSQMELLFYEPNSSPAQLKHMHWCPRLRDRYRFIAFHNQPENLVEQGVFGAISGTQVGLRCCTYRRDPEALWPRVLHEREVAHLLRL